MSAIKALCPWFGAKRRQIKGIVDAVGEHQVFWDICCGSAAVLFGKPRARQEVMNDLHGLLINLARVVQEDDLAVQLYEKLQRTAFSEDLYERSSFWLGDRERASFDVDLDAAYHYLIVSWMGRNGLAGTNRELKSGFCKRFTSNGGDPAVRWRSVVESVPWWWERLQGVTILRQDCISMAKRIEDKKGTVIYCDPPYFDEGMDYAHSFDADTHVSLAEALRRFTKTRVVVSYYDCDRVDTLYVEHGFEKIHVGTSKVMDPGAKKHAPEVLLVLN